MTDRQLQALMLFGFFIGVPAFYGVVFSPKETLEVISAVRENPKILAIASKHGGDLESVRDAHNDNAAKVVSAIKTANRACNDHFSDAVVLDPVHDMTFIVSQQTLVGSPDAKVAKRQLDEIQKQLPKLGPQVLDGYQAVVKHMADTNAFIACRINVLQQLKTI